MNTKQVGELSEARVLGDLLEAGYAVLSPWGDNQRYDFVIEKTGVFQRIQVKTARTVRGQQGALVFPTVSSSVHRTNGKKRGYAGDIDAFAVWSPQTKTTYLVPLADVAHLGMASLRIAPQKKTGGSHAPRWAKDYKIVHGPLAE